MQEASNASLARAHIDARAVFFFQAEDGIRDHCVTGVQTCALPISWTSLLSPCWRRIPWKTWTKSARSSRSTPQAWMSIRSEEHTSELQSHSDLVCRLLLEKKKNRKERLSRCSA